MIRRLALLALVATALACAAPATLAAEPSAPAARIVTLAPHLAELAFAAGAGDRVVAVSSYSDWPQAARALPVIAINGRIDMEALVAAKPDLVLAWQSGNGALQVARLQHFGFPVVVSEIRSFADIAHWIRAIGRLAGTAATAERAAHAFESEIAALAAHHAGHPPVPVFYEIWPAPLLTVNGAHLISRALELCGGQNVLAHARPLTPAVSLEQLLAIQPAAILVGASGAMAAQSIAGWRARGALAAVKHNAIYTVDPALVNRMGPRITEGIRALCAVLDDVRAKRRQ